MSAFVSTFSHQSDDVIIIWWRSQWAGERGRGHLLLVGWLFVTEGHLLLMTTTVWQLTSRARILGGLSDRPLVYVLSTDNCDSHLCRLVLHSLVTVAGGSTCCWCRRGCHGCCSECHIVEYHLFTVMCCRGGTCCPTGA